MRKLILGTGMGLSVPLNEQISMIKQVGFDGVFTAWQKDREESLAVAAAVRERGLLYHSIHAPFDRVHLLWESGVDGDLEAGRLITCLEDAARVGVALVIMHAIIGMERHTPTSLGIERFAKIFEAAEHLGVRVALENTEGEEYLHALMKAFENNINVGFCIDTGHEMCYNEGRDMIARYGSRLLSTHLNDNMGKTGERITWLDDSHMLPFDGGRADWEGIARRLNKVGYCGDLTFELTTKNKPERHCNDRYEAMTAEEYLQEAYEKACLVRELFQG